MSEFFPKPKLYLKNNVAQISEKGNVFCNYEFILQVTMIIRIFQFLPEY